MFFHLLDVSVVNSHLLFRSVTGSRMSQLDFRLAVAQSLTEGLECPLPAGQLAHVNSPSGSQRDPSLSRCPRANAQTALSVATEEWGNVTKRDIGARCVTHPCAYTPALSGTIRSKITK